MYIFGIDPNFNVTARRKRRKADVRNNVLTFASDKELAEITAEWPVTRLVAIWNKLPRVKSVARFASRSIAIQRIWTAVQAQRPLLGQDCEASDNSEQHLRIRKDSAKHTTKTAKIIALLKRDSGATIIELMEASKWRRHSVRGFVSRLPQRFGFRIKSFTRGGERAYRIQSHFNHSNERSRV